MSEDRVRDAEALIRALKRQINAMYDYDLEISWPRGANHLEVAYAGRYGVDFEPDIQDTCTHTATITYQVHQSLPERMECLACGKSERSQDWRP